MLLAREQTEAKKSGKAAKAPKAAAPRARPGEPAAVAARSALGIGLHWLRINDPEARAGEVEGVHHLRTTTRRLRSTLQLFAPMIDPTWSQRDHLGDELRWLAGMLGAVRDVDVLRDRLSDAGQALSVSESLGPLFADLDQRHAASAEALGAALQSDRYQALIVSLTDAAALLPLTDEAQSPCRDALPALVHDSWKVLKRGARALEEDASDEDFHEVRKSAKAARDAAEAVRKSLDPGARQSAKQFALLARRVQDVLGVHQDAVVALGVIRDAAVSHPQLGGFNFAAGRLLEVQLRAADESRAEFFRIWPDLDRKKVVRWLKP
jgi:CHAD domain-containing protein